MIIKQVVRSAAAGVVLAAAAAGLSATPAMAASPCADRAYGCIEYYAEPNHYFKTKSQARAKFSSIEARCRRDGGSVVRRDVYPSGDQWQPVVLCRLKRR